jgi:hypothetical protein
MGIHPIISWRLGGPQTVGRLGLEAWMEESDWQQAAAGGRRRSSGSAAVLAGSPSRRRLPVPGAPAAGGERRGPAAESPPGEEGKIERQRDADALRRQAISMTA